MRKTELMVLGEAIHPKTKASIVEHEHTNIEATLDQQNRVSSTITQSTSMSQVGLGDGVDLSFCVKDGFYENATLYGKTMVNCIQEPSIKDVVLPYEFEEGQYVTINDTKESGALGVELKGQTLVNLVTKTRAMGLQPQFDGDTITITSTTNGAWYSTTLRTVGMKAGGTYLLYTDSITYDDSLSSSPNLKSIVALYEMIPNRNLGGFVSNGAIKVTIPSDVDGSDIGLRIHATLQEGTGGTGKTTTVKGLKIIEYVEGMENWDIPYFEGMTSCKMPILHTVGKNLCGAMESGSFTQIEGEPVDYSSRIRTVDYIPIDGSYWISTETSTVLGLRYYDINKNCIGYPTVNTSAYPINVTNIPSGAKYLKFTVVDVTDVNYKIYLTKEQHTMGEYEPYKTSILSLPEEVVLRSLPNGVCDTFNTKTGVYTQRIWSATFNGAESYAGWESSAVAEGMTGIYTRTRVDDKIVTTENNDGIILCDTLPTIYRNQLSSCQYNSVVKGNNYIGFTMKGKTSDEIKQWLSENPTTVYCELKTPVVTKINLSSTLKSWNTTTHIYSEIPENTLYPTLSHSNPSYPVILKPSTKYSIVANSYSNGHTNSAINFNLGGATASTTVGSRVTTITTPSTLTSEELVMSGRGNKLNNVMVIEGDVVGDEPYFEGMCDSKSPILSNVGKNLFNMKKLINTGVASHSITGESAFTVSNTQANDWQNVRFNIGTLTKGTYVLTFDYNVKSGSHNVALRHGSHGDAMYDMRDNRNIIRLTKDYNDCYLQFFSSGRNKETGEVVYSNVMLTKWDGDYEPYKSNTTTFNQKDGKTIVLRSLPNGVCDTLNVETGEYTQRIGEYTYNGDNDVKQHYVANNNHGQPYFTIEVSSLGRKEAIGGIGDTLPHESIYSAVKQTKNAFCVSLGGNTVIRFYIDGLTTTEQYQNHFRNAPITIQYELATPIVSTIDVQGFPYTYKDGHVQLSSGHDGQSLTPKIEYVIQVNRAGTIQANQDRLINHDKRLAALESFMLCQLIQLEYNHAKCVFFAQTRQLFEGGNTMYHTKYDLLSEFIEKKLYRSLNEVCEMLDVYYMLGDITDGEYDTLYEMLLPTEEVEEFFEEAEESI